MSSAILACLVLSLFATTARAAALSKCPGGLSEGDVKVIGIYWYTCTDGGLSLQGCVTEDQKNIHLGDTFVTSSGKEMTCMKVNGIMNVGQTACMYKGQRVAPGATFTEGTVWYTCTHISGPSGDYLLWQASGCISQGKQLKFMDRDTVGSTVFECHGVGRDVQLNPIGCTFNGVTHLLGEQFNDDKFIYACEKDAQGNVKQQVYGCVYQGKTYYSDQRIVDGNQVYMCEVQSDHTAANVNLIGCALTPFPNGTVPVKKIGCYWIDETQSQGGQSYYVNCTLDTTTMKTKVSRQQCQYTYQDANQNSITVLLNPGCFRPLKDSDQSVGCAPNAVNVVQITTFPTDNAGSNGLMLC